MGEWAMNTKNSQEKIDTFKVRVTSVAFCVLTLAIFKPLGFDKMGLMAYLHLVVICVLGLVFCYITEAILNYIVRMPSSFEKGAEYIIRRNLWFQFINTPLMALMVCLYLHFVMKANGLPTPLTFCGYFTALLIIAFCSFAIGLYWRFKFRSKYLAAELEEVRQMNEKLKSKSLKSSSVGDNVIATPVTQSKEQEELLTLSGTTSDTVTTTVSNILYIESVGNYVKVIWLCDEKPRTDMLRATSKQIESVLSKYPTIVRCHRAFLVNLCQVDRVVSNSGTMQLVLRHSSDTIPVSRSNMAQVKVALKG